MKGIVLTLGGDSISALSPTAAIVACTPDGRFEPRIATAPAVFGAVIADLMSVRPGDRVFYFLRRGLYGSAVVAGHPDHVNVGSWVDSQGTVGIHLSPESVLFRHPLDMDEVLMRPGNETVSHLRIMGGKNFFQLDPDESRWLQEQFYRRNSDHSTIGMGDGTAALRRGLKRGTLTPLTLRSGAVGRRLRIDSKGKFGSEALLHAALIEKMRDEAFDKPTSFERASNLVSVHHEYPASPAKQAQYIDRIDVVRVFSAKTGLGYPVASHYDCWEMKTGDVDLTDFQSLAHQAMKYVDFIAASRLAGDYSRLRMSVVARGFPTPKVRQEVLEKVAERGYQLGVREHAISFTWDALRCLTYRWGKRGLELDVA